MKGTIRVMSPEVRRGNTAKPPSLAKEGSGVVRRELMGKAKRAHQMNYGAKESEGDMTQIGFLIWDRVPGTGRGIMPAIMGTQSRFKQQNR